MQFDSRLDTIHVIPIGHQRFVTDIAHSIMVLHSYWVPNFEPLTLFCAPEKSLVPTSELVTRLIDMQNATATTTRL